MKTWQDYAITLSDGQSYSKRVTSDGHITVSALVTLGGALKAFPPRAGRKAFPVFITLDASGTGRISQSFEGKFSQKGWEMSSVTHRGYGRLMGIFMDLYREIHLTPIVPPIPVLSPKDEASTLFSEGWRFWKNSGSVYFNNRTIGGTSLSAENADNGGKKFFNEIFDLVEKKFENPVEILKFLGQMTEEAGYH